MIPSPMTLQRFLELASAYGSELARWPEAERAAAAALLQSSEPARAAVAEEAELDRALDAMVAPGLSPELSRRLNEIPIRVPVARRARWPFRRLLAPALGWAVAAALGVALGARIADSEDGGSESVEASTNPAADQSPSDDALASLAVGSFADLEETP